jgi:hypothetical protein
MVVSGCSGSRIVGGGRVLRMGRFDPEAPRWGIVAVYEVVAGERMRYGRPLNLTGFALEIDFNPRYARGLRRGSRVYCHWADGPDDLNWCAAGARGATPA